MPMQMYRYPVDWHEIAFAIKEACDWQCQMCGIQCRRPGEVYDTQRRTLTVAHYDHLYDEEAVFVVALCAPCHLRHDAHHNLQLRRAHRYRHHMALFRQRRSEVTWEDIEALAADWPDMPDFKDGIDILAEKYGPPTGGDL